MTDECASPVTSKNPDEAQRVIAHVDMDAFFVAVERRDDPSLVGRQVIVGGTGNRGVVAAASYEARRLGVHSAMPMTRARRLCPNAVYIPASHTKYSAASGQVMALLRTFTPTLQAVSVDEAYLDLTGTERLHGPPFVAATKMRNAVMNELGFSASVGVASNRLMAKVSSVLSKPAGILHILPGMEAAILAPLSIDTLPGVGKVTAARLRGMGMRTIGDIAHLPLSVLEANFKNWGTELYRKARGQGSIEIEIETKQKSVGKETTFSEDQGDPNHLEATLSRLTAQAASRLRRKNMTAKGVTLKIRFEDFDTNTLAARMEPPTAIDRPLFEAARRLLTRALQEKSKGRKVRLIGVYLGGLASANQQPELFVEESERDTRLTETVDRLRDRFGEGSLVSGKSMEGKI
ncbi:MAG: DNA polymerase IV [Nitrospinaceae bacterium]|jgi:DNA polymerase IV|nr:DNA polymerase IV [Nitrospinaceae bacterium]MBT3434749.1 DNA polymerase IV [Nitrospinaceae bacterium]MBT3822044.1 DNA polymerase IV [Nitrospinaceae bacterium]MBT4430885.1 DNA polymerase IV [Nitrospinaceae bacterium]MBT5368103.1 DNA polymerase IV [Nitrospinaceae bacterium]